MGEEFYFDENAFKNKVNNALEKVKTILESHRHPQWPADVPHQYDDKYLLAEFVGTNTISALLHILTTLGANEKTMQTMKEWAKKRSVSLRLKSEETCKFLRKTVREVESDTKSVTKSTLFGTRESYTVTKVTEWFWAYDVNYELIAFMGNEPDKGIRLQGRRGAYEIKTTSETTPRPAQVVCPSLDVNISWLLANIDEHLKPKFSIDRAAKSCHTPRRNQQVDDAWNFMVAFYRWANSVQTYIRSQFPIQSDHGLDLNTLREAAVFVPVLPVFEKAKHASKKEKKEKKEKKSKKNLLEGSGGRPVPLNMAGPFISEQSRSLAERFNALGTVFPANDKLVTVAEAKLIVLCMHSMDVCKSFAECVDYIEDMLRKQLIAAIGKEVQPTDFTNYLRFHNRKLFRPEYQPRPFCYAVRRPAHVPEGTLSIETQLDDGLLADPIYTSVCYAPAVKPMKFALSAASEVSFGGDRYLHAWVSHQFSGYSGQALNLVARARQFSSFILLVGSIAAADLFMPKFGIIIQNKDELKIPLLLETIPTPKEFKDAISSLSPEQQRFAKGFRSMQLESTLFGVCIIQIKPQLEKLLKLPEDALTKEIALTEELLNLFIEYQIPSDLLSYDGPEDASVGSKVAKVKEYAANMRKVIQESAALAAAQEAQNLRLAEIDIELDRDEKDSEEAEEDEAPRSRHRMAKGKKYEKAEKREKVKEKEKKESKEEAKKDSKPSSGKQKRRSMHRRAGSPAREVPADAAGGEGGGGGAAPVPPTPALKKPEEPKKEPGKAEEAGGQAPLPTGEMAPDLTKVPQQLEAKFEELDPESSLRPTIITAGPEWMRKHKKALLSPIETSHVSVEETGNLRNRTFDLLDALTKSGALTVDHAALHVVIAATHCFDKTLMNTVIQDNVNPIEKVERSSLIVASTIQNRPPVALIAPEQVERIGLYSPMLLEDADDDDVPTIEGKKEKEVLPVKK